MEGDPNGSDVGQNESDNGYSRETQRKKLNTSLDTMGISPVHLHDVAQHSRVSTAKNKLDRAVEVLINLLVLNLLMLFLNLNQRHQSLIVCTIWWKRSWLTLRTLKRYRFCTRFMIPSILCWTFNVSEYLVRTARELKKVKGILAKPAQKQGKVISQIPLIWCLACMRMMSLVARCFVKTTMLALQKEFKRNLCCLQGKIS